MDVVIVGDGPGGLSAALFLAKADLKVVVFGQDETAMNWAFLYNYLGFPHISGTEFQVRAKQQVRDMGADLRDVKVTAITRTDAGFQVALEGGGSVTAPILVLSEGKAPVFARALGCAAGDSGIAVDRNGLTSVPGVYAVGRMVRPTRSQAIISAGDGAAAALDILARAQGKDVQDWDSPPK